MSVIDPTPDVLAEKRRLEKLLGEACYNIMGTDRHFVLLFQVMPQTNHSGCISTMEPPDMLNLLKEIVSDYTEFCDARTFVVGGASKTEH